MIKLIIYLLLTVYFIVIIKLYYRFKPLSDEIELNNIPENIDKRRNLRLKTMAYFAVYTVVFLFLFVILSIINEVLTN